MYKKIFDGKTLRSYLNYRGAAKPPSCPLVSMLIRCESEWEEKQFGFHGYHQKSIYQSDLVNIDDYDIIVPSVSDNLTKLEAYLKETKPDACLLWTNYDLLSQKIRCLEYDLNEYIEDRALTEKQQTDWLKKTARDKYGIDYIKLPERDDIDLAFPGILHLMERNADKISGYFTFCRRIFNFEPDVELDILDQDDSIKVVVKKFRKKLKETAKNKAITCNINGNHVKGFVVKWGEAINARINYLNNQIQEDKIDVNEANFTKMMILWHMHYIEQTFEFISMILTKYNKLIKYNSDQINELLAILQRGIKIFKYLWTKCKFIVTPTCFATFVTLPFALINLSFRNCKNKTCVLMGDLSDQLVENNVQYVKKRMESNNNRQYGQMQHIMQRKIFGLAAALYENQFIYYTKSDTKPWFEKIYDTTKWDSFSRRCIGAMRGGEISNEMKQLMESDRVIQLEKYGKSLMDIDNTNDEMMDIDDNLSDINDDNLEMIDLSNIMDVDHNLSNTNNNSSNHNKSHNVCNTRSRRRIRRKPALISAHNQK